MPNYSCDYLQKVSAVDHVVFKGTILAMTQIWEKVQSSDGLREQLQKEIKDLQCSTERWKHGETELNKFPFRQQQEQCCYENTK